MLSFEFYKVFHILGVVALFTGLGGAALHAANGGTKKDNPSRKLVSVLQAVALVLLLVAGFGMLARLQLTGSWPGWVWAKVVLWVVFGALVALPGRVPASGKPLLLGLPALGALAGWLAVFKPF